MINMTEETYQDRGTVIPVDLHILGEKKEQQYEGHVSVGKDGRVMLSYRGKTLDVSKLDIMEFKKGSKHGFCFEHGDEEVFVESNGHTKYFLRQAKKTRNEPTPRYIEMANVLATA